MVGHFGIGIQNVYAGMSANDPGMQHVHAGMFADDPGMQMNKYYIK